MVCCMHLNARRAPHIKYVCQGKMYLSKTKIASPEIRCLLRKMFYCFMHLIHKACQILSAFTNQCHCLHLHLPNIPSLFTLIPQHTIISLIYLALLKTLHIHFWWDALPCHCDPHWLNITFVFLGLWNYWNP